jgi:hypothetical protein
MQEVANSKPGKKQITAFPRAAYSIPEFSALFGREQTWGYRMVYSGKVKVIPSGDIRGGNMVPHSEVERLLSLATNYSDDIAGKPVPRKATTRGKRKGGAS